MRKVNFEELLSFLPENFDSELAQTLELYRYKRAEPELEPVIEPETRKRQKEITNEEIAQDITEELDRKTLRSGKIYALSINTFCPLPIEKSWFRLHSTKTYKTNPKLEPILNKTYEPPIFLYPMEYQKREESEWYFHRNLDIRINTITKQEKEFRSKNNYKSRFASKYPGTLTIQLAPENDRRRVRFKEILVYFY